MLQQLRLAGLGLALVFMAGCGAGTGGDLPGSVQGKGDPNAKVDPYKTTEAKKGAPGGAAPVKDLKPD